MTSRMILTDLRRKLCKCHKVKKTKFKALCLGWGGTQYQYGMEKEWMESSPMKKDFGTLLNEKLDISQQCGLAALKGNHILGCIKDSMDSKLRKVILPLLSCETPSRVLHTTLQPPK